MHKNRKSICFVVTSPLTANSFLMKHFEVLAVKYDIYLVANFASFPYVPNDHIKGTFNLKISRKISIISDFQCLISLISYFMKMRFDAVHSVTPKAGLIGMLASQIALVKNRIHIFTGQVWFTRTGIAKYTLMFFDRFIAFLTTCLLVDSHAQRSFLIDNKIISERKSEVLGMGSISGVNLTKFLPDKYIKQTLREELGFKGDDIVFGFLGRLARDKGILDLASAFKELKPTYKHIKLLFIGVDEENLIQYIKDNIGDKDMTFYGHSNEPHKILQTCDIFCMPSYREGFGTSIIEASMMELPVICSDTYGLYDTIIDNQTGLRHKVGDIKDLKNQMEKLITEPLLRAKMGLNGIKYVRENFADEIVSHEWLKFYTKILDN